MIIISIVYIIEYRHLAFGAQPFPERRQTVQHLNSRFMI